MQGEGTRDTQLFRNSLNARGSWTVEKKKVILSGLILDDLQKKQRVLEESDVATAYICFSI